MVYEEPSETDDEQIMSKLYPLKTNYWFDGSEPG